MKYGALTQVYVVSGSATGRTGIMHHHGTADAQRGAVDKQKLLCEWRH